MMKLNDLITETVGEFDEISNKLKVKAVAFSAAEEAAAKSVAANADKLYRSARDLYDSINNDKNMRNFVKKAMNNKMITQGVDIKELAKAVDTLSSIRERMLDMASIRRGQKNKFAKGVK